MSRPRSAAIGSTSARTSSTTDFRSQCARSRLLSPSRRLPRSACIDHLHETRRGANPTPLGCVPTERLPSIPAMPGPRPGSGAESDVRPSCGRRGRWAQQPSTLLAVLRMSTLFVRTLREDPADAEVASHRLMTRAGYIRRAAPGRVHLAAARVDGAIATSSASSARRWTPPASRRSTSRRCCPRAPYEASRPLDRLRRQHVPAPGPARQRLPPRPDARGDVHAAREGPLLVATATCR